VKRIHYLVVTATVILLDLWTKWLIVKRLDLHQSIPIIPNFFQLVHVRNTGAAFGIGANADSRIIPLLLNGGAIGNLLDRFRFGYVVDFLDVYVRNHHWPAFNVADSAICIGIGLLFLDMKKKPETESAAAVPAAD
jgi:signal peptidase II